MAQGKKSVDSGRGYLVLRGTHVDKSEDEVAQLISLFTSRAFGTPTRTDKRLQRFAWPVRYEKTDYTSPTFSQTMAEAAFHTDSQYLDEPERYFGLYCVASDVQGKGTNFLVSRQQIVEKLTASHPAALEHLKSSFPFRVPSVFTAGASDEDIEVVWAPIIAGGSIRFRRDTIMSALALPGVAVSDGQLAAMDALEQAISEAPALNCHLEPGEAIIVDNHSMMHSRSPFSDSNRLLYRVRMKEQDPSANAEQGGLTDISRKPREITEDHR
ncbi:TauD/TfdA family dioxygenase [Paenarthrobacter nitroguajacolicus]